MKTDDCATRESPSDNELVLLAKNGDSAAFSALSDRFMPVLARRAGRYSSIASTDIEDFLQEGMFALFRAVKGYDQQSGIQFNTYAITCINHSMASVMKLHMKNSAQNTNVCIDEMDDQTLYHKTPLRPQADPVEDICIDMEAASFRTRQIEALLSDFERQVLRLYLKGYSYEQISQVLSIATKAVDNALQRVRRKLRSEMKTGQPSPINQPEGCQ